MEEAYRWEGEKCVAHDDKGQLITTWRRPIGEKCVAHDDKGQPITTWRRPIGEKCMAHDDKGQPITTWRRPIGGKVRSVWLMMTKVSPLLHRGDL